jgi:hypothetical protein
MMLAQQQARLDRQEAQRAQLQADQQEKRDLRDWQGDVGQAYQAAQQYGQQRYAESGLDPSDPYGIMKAFRADLDLQRAQMPEMAAPSAYFGNSLYDSAYDRVRSGERNRLTGQANQFAGSGFETDMFGDTMDDPILQSILDSQYNDAKSNFERQSARGQLTGSAFSRALADLDTAKAGAFGKLNDIGGGVLQGYRSKLADYGNNIRNKISTFDFGQGFDLEKEKQGLNTLADSFRARLEGDVRNAIGGTSLFDISKLITNANQNAGTLATTGNVQPGTSQIDDLLNRNRSQAGAF